MPSSKFCPLSPPAKGPIAIRPQYIVQDENTVLHVKENNYSLARRDFTVRKANGQTLMTVSGKTLSVNLQREFLDASGLPLFELRKRQYPKKLSSSAGWSLALPGSEPGQDYDDVLSATFKSFWVHPKLDIKLKNLAPPQHMLRDTADSAVDLADSYHENVLLQVRGQDSARLTTHVMCEGRKVIHIRRQSDELTESVYPHGFGYKPEWEVTVARGVDVALAVVIVVILAEHRY
ncbi:hypothetical protein LTR08_002043 [Meristemomyces frigidus]|nr:hypothetical protein LTR08_002043 [Meristemomyces frigidus]